MGSWKKTKWGEVATLEYGKALRDYDEEMECIQYMVQMVKLAGMTNR